MAMFKRKAKNDFSGKVIRRGGSGIGQALARCLRMKEPLLSVPIKILPDWMLRRLLAGGAHLFFEQDVADRQSFMGLSATVKKEVRWCGCRDQQCRRCPVPDR